ncbi:MAG: hypothetical protein MZV63_37280 [Marinilabiliales bacterium]|nr:hypothetical protein [Marinilabiliales bacterium]
MGLSMFARIGGIHDLRMRAEEHGRGCYNHGCRIHEGRSASSPISVRVRLNGFTVIPAGDQGIGEVLHHLLRASVHRDVRDHDFVFHRIGYPVSIGIEDELRVFVDRAVAGCDHRRAGVLLSSQGSPLMLLRNGIMISA